MDEPPRTDRSAPPVLRAEHVVKTFGRPGLRAPGRRHEVFHAVDDVSLELLPGRTLGLVGESGCGKSTLAHVLLALTKPTSGSVWYQGRDVFGMDRRQLRAFRRGVQMVFQDPEASLNPRMRVEDVIGEAWVANPEIVPRTQRAERVRELMELVGLNPSHATRYPHQFSGGQRQRIGIARALAVEPRVLVCDEPVSSLDVSVQAQIINLFQRLQQDLDVSYLFIAHDLAVVRHIADTVAVMRDGQIVELGPTDQVYDDPKHAYTRKLLEAIPLPEPHSRGRVDHGVVAKDTKPWAR
jgi:oligopeptide transport system ATP-binding protein